MSIFQSNLSIELLASSIFFLIVSTFENSSSELLILLILPLATILSAISSTSCIDNETLPKCFSRSFCLAQLVYAWKLAVTAVIPPTARVAGKAILPNPLATVVKAPPTFVDAPIVVPKPDASPVIPLIAFFADSKPITPDRDTLNNSVCSVI